MLQLKKILVPRDPTYVPDRAVRKAIDLAERTGAEVHLLFAEVLHGDVLEKSPEGESVDDQLRSQMMRGVADMEFDADVHFVIATVCDVLASAAIDEYAAEHDIDLIVMGTRGRRGVSRMLLGSTAEEVVRTAPCPVLTVRNSESSIAGIMGVEAILVPIDFSDHSNMALHNAKELAALYHARVDLLHIVEDHLRPTFYDAANLYGFDHHSNLKEKVIGELETFFENAGGPPCETTFNVSRGHASSEIISFTEEHDSDMVVMATHGLHGLEHMLIGSVAEKVVRSSPVPVFTVKSFGRSLVPELHLAAANAV